MDPREVELRKIYTGKHAWHEEHITDSLVLQYLRDYTMRITVEAFRGKGIFRNLFHHIEPMAANCINIKHGQDLGIQIIIVPGGTLCIEVMALMRSKRDLPDGVGEGFMAYSAELNTPEIFDRLKETLSKLYDGPWREWDIMDYVTPR
jgi:hypothetical protein